MSRCSIKLDIKIIFIIFNPTVYVECSFKLPQLRHWELRSLRYQDPKIRYQKIVFISQSVVNKNPLCSLFLFLVLKIAFTSRPRNPKFQEPRTDFCINILEYLNIALKALENPLSTIYDALSVHIFISKSKMVLPKTFYSIQSISTHKTILFMYII